MPTKYAHALDCHPKSWENDCKCGLLQRIRQQVQPQPEPEYVDLEIVAYQDDMYMLGVWAKSKTYTSLPYPFTHLHRLPSLPGFRGFRRKGNMSINLELIACVIAQGEKVIARFAK